jgi:hypothetical protein
MVRKILDNCILLPLLVLTDAFISFQQTDFQPFAKACAFEEMPPTPEAQHPVQTLQSEVGKKIITIFLV